jgi:1-deoxy-D-xylulose-5-phosphate reductoisomerase
MARRLVILGATGSIGRQALEVLQASDDLQLVGLAAGSSWQELVAAAQRFRVKAVAIGDPQAAAAAKEGWAGKVFSGEQGAVELIEETAPDLVLNAVVGAAGLRATVATVEEGIDLALANKESLVVGGELVCALARETGAAILPVDSEHAALHQLLEGEQGRGERTVERLVLTASGGPFRGRSEGELAGVSVAQALAHPTWSMGGKITIDSATLMNKGLELIEAHHLFGLPYERIEVVVHPQSIVHGLVVLCDGSVLAHLGHPDMRVPISYALHYPRRMPLQTKPLDLAAIGSLSFEAPDERTFRCLALARRAAQAGGTAPCVLNAANEVAVGAFLAGELPFLGIAEVIERTLDALPTEALHSFDQLYACDRRAREVAEGLIAELVG